jgi:2-amino-4-hydroxy-6-hydroxymethyldihydropteridine diphosphokinase
MTKCLIGLGSNLGDRAATLDGAIAALSSAPGVELVRASSWQLTLPVGGETSQREFLNGAAVLETSREPANLLELLQQVESQFGRERHERWGSRTLDLDLLLYGDAIIETPTLTVPHPRMSFRRFVLEPAVEIAGEWVHPTIGWTLERLLDHLDTGADCVAVVSSDDGSRRDLVAELSHRFGIACCGEDESTPPPKLTVLLGGTVADEWDRGPTLRVPTADGQDVNADVFAAVEAVWPRLGPAGDVRLQ